MDSVKSAMTTLKEHMYALEQMERPEMLRELIEKVREIDVRLNDVLPRIQKLSEVSERLRQVHEDMGRLQNALAA